MDEKEIQASEETIEETGEAVEAAESEVPAQDDVEYAVIAGRKKNGEPFLNVVGTEDVMIIQGVIEYAKAEADYIIADYIARKRGQA